MLGDVSDRAPILAAQAQPLDHPQGEEEEGGGQSDRFVGRYQSDASRADAHASQGDEEGVLAAYPIAQPPEEECAQRTNQESGREQRDRGEQGRDRVGLFKELDRQNRSEAAEDIEVVPLDDVSD